MLGRLDTDKQTPWDVLTCLDVRSLRLFRITLALTLLFDLSERLLLVPYFFTEQGILPYSLWNTLFGHKTYYWSFHFFEDAGPAYALILVQIIAASALLVGYRPRLMALLSWLLLLSLNLRNPMLTYGGDKLAPTLLLIASLLPLPHHQRLKSTVSGWSRLGGPLLALQMAILYMAAGFSKAFESHWLAGTAVRNALNMDLLAKPRGVWASQADSLLLVSSLVTPTWEIALGALLLVPSWRGRPRTFAVLGLLSLNLGIWLTMDVGYFMMYASAGLLALIPSSLWDHLGRRWRIFQKRTSESLPSSLTRPSPLDPVLMLQRIVAIWLMVTFSLTFLEGLKAFPRLQWSPWLWTAIRAPNAYQNWDLFRNPGSTAQWYVSKAKLANGTVVDLLRDGKPVDYRRKRSRNDLFVDSFRWRLCFAKANKFWKHSEARDQIARNVALYWNAHHPPEEQAQSIAVYKMTKKLFRNPPNTRHYKVFSEIPKL